ncbi:MAG TPA: oxidoreductase [Gemmatimonadaceae bacterium]
MIPASGRTAIVTGASTGVGHAIAKALARAGFTVFGTSRDPTKTPLRNVSMLTCDLTDSASVDALVSTVLARMGRIHVLVNNADVTLIAGAEESSLMQVRALFDANLFGVMRMTNAVLPAMRKTGGGRIINIGSVFGVMPSPFGALYSASKHALESYSESLDHEVRAFNIRVSLIAPALTRNGFDQNVLEPDAPLQEYDQARAHMHGYVQELLAVAEPSDVVADAVLLAATATRPRRRYPAGKAGRRADFLRRFMPTDTFDKAIRKARRLPN